VLKLFEYAREKGFAIPAVNVTSSSTVVAALEAARDAKAPIMYGDTPPCISGKPRAGHILVQ